jgi:hypothetical protein
VYPARREPALAGSLDRGPPGVSRGASGRYRLDGSVIRAAKFIM